MHTVLVGPEIEENLSLRYLASALRDAGNTCTLVPFNVRKDLSRVARAVLRRHPDLVGLSLVAQRRYRDYRELIARLRASGYSGHITAGGHFASLRAPEILRDTPGLDTVIHHDGEDRIVRLLALLAPRRTGPSPLVDGLPAGGGDPEGRTIGVDEALDGISWRGPGGVIRTIPAKRVADLDSLPFPVRRRPARTLGFALAPMVTSRGCSGSCSFCSIHAWHRQVPSGRLRFRSPGSVVEEMVRLHREQGVRVFVFHDDDFIHPDPGEALRRCRRILDAAEREIGRFAFVIKCRPDDVGEELFRYLKARGLVRAYVGIETHAVSGLTALGRKVSPETNLRALRILRDLDVHACFNLLLFHPDTTMGELRENLAFLRDHLGTPFDVARTELYARSILERRMLREGRALGDYRGYDYRISDPRAEKVFQGFASILWDRHFGADSVLHRVQDLGLRLSLLKRFHPGAASADLVERVRGLVLSINTDTVDYLERIAAGCTAPSAEADRAMKEEVALRVQQQSARIWALALELECRGRIAALAATLPASLAALPSAAGRLAATVAAVPGIALLLGPLACSESVRPCDPPPPPARYSTDIEPLLNRSCATEGCHAGESAAAGLDLTTGVSRANLVNVRATQVPRLFRVKPDEPDSSYLVDKMEGTQEEVGGSGDRMPPNGPSLGELADRIRQWILRGAPDD